MEIKPSELKYVILPGRFCPEEYLDLYDLAFEFWSHNWSVVFKELKSEKMPNADDFFRQDFVPVIVHEEKILAIHHYSLYDLRPDCSIKHSYLDHNFTGTYFQKLREMRLFKLMSMESLFVDPDYRKSRTGIKISEVLISLGQKIFTHLTDAEAYFAPARVDNKVAQTCQLLGWESVESNITLNNVPVDLMIGRRGKVIPPADSKNLFVSEYLWKNRINLATQPNEVQDDRFSQIHKRANG